MSLVLSLFPGIGLLDRAFEEEGFCVVRGPDLLWGGDVKRFHPPAGKFDGVIGGPPCQAFSRLRHLVEANGYKVKHGNLIPEFVRVVGNAGPEWFLMENVPAAPKPYVYGYAHHSFELDNAWLGEEQMRRRCFTFGIMDSMAIDLRRWIELAALEAAETTQAVTGHAEAVPVAIGGSGKVKRRAVRGKNDGNPQPWEIANGRAYGYRRSWAERCVLQGLPETFLDGAPFTAPGKSDVLGNGVPLPMGRAIAKAVKKAIEGA